MSPAAKYFLIVAGALAAIAGPSTLAAPAAPETSELGTKSAPVKTNTALLEGKWHSIKMTPRSGLPAIHFYDKLNPVWWLQNSDEPAPPPGYKPNKKRKNIKGPFRNPFHNFGNYVIGIAEKPHLRSGRY